MITLDNLRSALRHPQPWAAMDELVRAEQAAGRKVQEIHDELRVLVEPVRAAENPPEDADDAMMDTLDALSGNCRSEDCYKDPPNNTPPSEEEIAKLPRWARVALAARCARRVLPLFSYTTSESRQSDMRFFDMYIDDKVTVENAIIRAELAAFECESSWDTNDFAGDVTPRAMKFGGESVAHVSNAAASADLTARCFAHDPPVPLSPHADIENESILATHAAGRSASIASNHFVNLNPYLRRDFDHLLRIAEWQHWTDDTPVPPDVFGPPWPEGPPPGWPADSDVPQRTELPVAFLALERVLPAMLEDEAVNVFNALNRYYIARTGHRLTLEGDIHTFLSALVGAGV